MWTTSSDHRSLELASDLIKSIVLNGTLDPLRSSLSHQVFLFDKGTLRPQRPELSIVGGE